MQYLVLSLVFVIVALAAPHQARAETPQHGLSLFGTPALEADFKYFPYVNPNAPKGGTLRLHDGGGFDNLNAFTIKGNTVGGIGLIHDTLMISSLDETSTAYGLIAKSVSHPDDYSSATFPLRREARFHDGTAVTAEDVAFSLAAIVEASPFYRAYYAEVTRSEILGPHKIRFHFARAGNRELPFIVGQLPVLSKAYWSANGRSLDDTTLDIPPGSGPYRSAALEASRSITY